MRSLLPLLALALCVSCTVNHHEAYSRTVAGSVHYEQDTLFKLGGTASASGTDGSSIVTDDQASFATATTALTSLATASIAAGVTKAVTSSNNAASTAQAGIAAKAATTQQAAQLAAEDQAADTAAKSAATLGRQGIAQGLIAAGKTNLHFH